METNLSIKIQLLHILLAIPNPNKGAQLRVMLVIGMPLYLVLLLLPALAEEVDAGRGAEEALLVAVRLLGHLMLKNILILGEDI